MRPATPADEPFLAALVTADQRRALASTGLPDEQVDLLAALQWRARRDGHATAWPAAHDVVVVQDGRPVGRLLVDDSGDSIHLVDVVVAVGERGRGVGTALLAGLVARADAEGRAVTLSVARDDPAVVGLYRRTGFAVVGETAVHLAMRRDPATAAPRSPPPGAR